jgi:phosphoglycolate phosphatase-like HAD superfamily hydrolase
LTSSIHRDGWVLPEKPRPENSGWHKEKNGAGLRALPRAQAYLFDIDGTLLNSRDGVHYNAFRNAIRQVWGIETRLDDVPVHGNTDLGIIRAVLEKAGQADKLVTGLPGALELMRAEVEKNVSGINAELCPSVRALIEQLHGNGKILGVASGNLESIGWAKLTVAGLRPFFSLGSFSDTRELRADIFRHGIEQARALLRTGPENDNGDAVVCMIGDTPFDIRAARSNSAPVVAVATGIYRYEELLSHEPDLCLHCCSDLFEPSRL